MSMLRLVSPVRRSGSSIPQFVKRLPADIAERLVGMRLTISLGTEAVPYTVPKSGIRFSLRTEDPREAKARQGEVVAYLERVFESVRNDTPVTLTNRHAVALSRAIYAAWAGGEGRERIIAVEHTSEGIRRVFDHGGEEEAEGFLAMARRLEALDGSDPAELEPILGGIVDGQLAAMGVGRLDGPSRARVLEAFRKALLDAMALRARHAAGDYTPDPNAERFPAWEEPRGAEQIAGGARPSSPSPSPPSSGRVSLTGLLEGWWREQGGNLAASTFVNYRGAVRKLKEFLGHEDAARVTSEDLLRFKDNRIAKGISTKTVKDGDLSALRTVMGWGLANRKLAANAAAGLKVKLPKRQRLGRPKGLTEEEARAVLTAASELQPGMEMPETFAAKRWCPWLMAYTGARVGEVAQLRKQDLVRDDEEGFWSIRITPEAGTVKGRAYRDVPLHPHLIELGFVRFVKAAPKGHLFLRPNAETGDVGGPRQGVVNRLAERAREHVTDPGVSPNHGWRHRFITLCRKHGVSDELRRMITGHTGGGVDEREYGDPAGLYREICKLPRIELGAKAAAARKRTKRGKPE